MVWKMGAKIIFFETILLSVITLSSQSDVLGAIKEGSSEGEDGKSSLVFVFDTTGSMHNDLRQLREGAEMILQTALEESNVIADFVFVPFHDPAVGPATVTKSKEVFKSALNMVRVYGGGDCPEKSLGGIQLALNVSRPRSFVYVFTDATASDHRNVGKVLETIQRKQSQVVFVLTGHCNDLHRPHYKVYQQISAASFGQVFNLNKTSVHKVLDFVRSSIKGRSVNLASAVNPPGYNYTKQIPVDQSVSEVTVSVSGAKPQIHVVNPSGQEVTGPPQLVITLDLSEIMIVKVLNPEPGSWRVRVGSAAEHSVKVAGLSDLTFAHGFSVSPPRDLAETSYRPLKGAYNHLLISLSGSDRPVRVQTADILSLNGETKFEVNLKEVGKGLYKADAFIPPEDFFYIAVRGHDEYGQEFKRIGSTAIQSKTPDVPYLDAPKKVSGRRHERVSASCRAESLVPLSVTWARGDARLHNAHSLQSTSLDLVIEDMSEQDEDSYDCVAKNAAGVSKVTTVFELIVDPPEVKISASKLSLSDGESLTVSCGVISEASLMSAHLEFRGKENTFVTKFEIEPNDDGVYSFEKTVPNVSSTDAGTYTCVAVNRGGPANESLVIVVQTKPTAQILGPHTLVRSEHADVQAVCHVENALEVHWLDPKHAVVKTESVHGSFISTLDIKNVSQDGVWTCVAVRNNYTATDTVQVSVLYKPRVHIEGPKNITIVNGTSHAVTCMVTAKPPPRILWHMETERFLDNTVTQIQPNTYKSVLTLNSSVEDVRAMFFCVGENAEGIHQDSVSVNVRRKMAVLRAFTDLTTELYSNVHLPCVVDSYPPPKIAWYHNNSALNFDDNVSLVEDDSSIIIRRVDFHNLGSYRCVAENGYENVSVSGNLEVHGLEAPSIERDVKMYVAKKGEAVSFTCRVLHGKPKPNITWEYKNSSKFIPLPKDIIQSGCQINISSVNTEHKGVYRCTARNIIGVDTWEVQVNIQYPPEDTNLRSSTLEGPLLLKVGSQTTLSCNFLANPVPIVVWTKNSQPIAFSNRVFLKDNGDLVLENVSDSQSGVYTCNATNSLGSSHKNFAVEVFMAPIITVRGSELEIEVLEGQLVELPCTAAGAPAPRVSWLHNGRRIAQPRKRIDDTGLRFIANLTDFGDYSCVASNEHGVASLNYTVFVWVAPFIKGDAKEVINVQVGHNASLQCDAVGFPIPEVLWEFQDNLLTENSSDIYFNDVGDLYVRGASAAREGVYACVAQNIAGTATKMFQVSVIESPRFVADALTGPYVASTADSALTLSCRAAGRPAPYVYWIKDGYYLDKDSRYEADFYGTLTIKNPTEDLSGTYTCLAKNAAGNITKDIPVEIYPLHSQMSSDSQPSTMTVLEGTDVNVECPVARHTDVVKWYKDAVLLSNTTLVIHNVSRANASTFACVANNAVSSAFAQVFVDVQWPPKFLTNEASELEVLSGDDVYFNCDNDAKPSAKIKWLFNSKAILGEDKSKFKLLNVRQAHAGLYQCVVRNEHGTIHKQYSLGVLEAPQISTVQDLEVTLKIGVNATLDCNAKGSQPTITWIYNNTHWRVEDTKLIVSNVTDEAQGYFRCEASNRAGRTHITYRVSVVSAPNIVQMLLFVNGQPETVNTTVDIAVGSNARIACKAIGNPTPLIQWIRYGNTLSRNADEITYADLVLTNVSSSQSGEYHCFASNEVGFTQEIIEINVLEPPRIFQSLLDNANMSEKIVNLEVLSGQAFFMQCHPYGNPTPEVYWFKDGVPLHLYDDTMVTTDFGEVVLSNGAKREHSGNYTCVARNRVGETSTAYLVNVLSAPSKQKEDQISVTQAFGRPLNLTCPGEGTPRPYVTWIKLPYTEIAESSRIQLLNDNYTMIINNTRVSDSGKYTCIVTNKVGTTEIIFDVTIERAPSIVGKTPGDTTETHQVALGRSVVLKCDVIGHPTPQISWIKDIQPLGTQAGSVEYILNGSVVTVWSVRARHAGAYACVAQNRAGIAQRHYDVIVKVPGKWSTWSDWSYCNVTCGLGYQLRSRACQYTDEDNNVYDATNHPEKIILDETTCKGLRNDSRKCHMPACEEPVPSGAGWSRWSAWGTCSATCGAGSQMRARRCRRQPCPPADNLQIRKCPNLPKCEDPSIKSNNVYNSLEDVHNSLEYTPAATFEMQPENDSYEFDDDTDYYEKPSAEPLQMIFYDVNVTENFGYDRGPCKVGYRHNTATDSCEDVDECAVEVNHCHSTQVCANTAGAYRCGCARGFHSLGLGQRCLDVNECELGVSGCEFACVNVAGGFVCACPPGLRLRSDRRSCRPPGSSRIDTGNKDENYLSTSIINPTRYFRTRQ